MRSRDAARRLLRAARLRIGVERPIVLMYHRVETLPCDPWCLAVTPERFAQQIALLRQKRDVVPLAWLARKIAQGKLPHRVAAITFDDGYSDVFHNALPVLSDSGCPATLFITTEAVENPSIYWWDILSRIILETHRLPDRLSLDITGVHYTFGVVEETGQGIPTGSVERRALHSQLHGLLRLAKLSVRQEALCRLAEWAGTDASPLARDRAMTLEEIRQFSAASGMEIGAHTLTHPSLPSLEAEDRTHEVAASRRRCEAIIERSVTGFAYPFGDFDAESSDAVRAAGLSYACSTELREVGRSADPFAIPRVLAADWDESDFRHKVLAHG